MFTSFELWQLEQVAKLELQDAKQAVTDLLVEQDKWQEKVLEARKAILQMGEKLGEAYKRQFDAEVAWLAANARAKLGNPGEDKLLAGGYLRHPSTSEN